MLAYIAPDGVYMLALLAPDGVYMLAFLVPDGLFVPQGVEVCVVTPTASFELHHSNIITPSWLSSRNPATREQMALRTLYFRCVHYY